MTEEPLKIEVLTESLRLIMRKLYQQIALDEKLDEYLKEPRRFIEIFAAKGYKELKLAESFINYLADLKILSYEDEKFQWALKTDPGSRKERDVVEKEAIALKMVQEKAMALYGILKKFSDSLVGVLKGEKGDRDYELAIWDSLYISDLYNFLRKEAIKRSGLKKNGVLIDLGCRSGWSTINLVELLSPKEVIAIDSSEIMLELAYQNILAMGYADKVKLVLADVINPIKLSARIDGIFANLIFNRYESSHILDILFNIAPLLEDEGIFAGLQPVKADSTINYAELMLFADPEFRGYPTFETFYRAFEKSGFKDLKIEKGMFFNAIMLREKKKK